MNSIQNNNKTDTMHVTLINQPELSIDARGTPNSPNRIIPKWGQIKEIYIYNCVQFLDLILKQCPSYELPSISPALFDGAGEVVARLGPGGGGSGGLCPERAKIDALCVSLCFPTFIFMGRCGFQSILTRQSVKFIYKSSSCRPNDFDWRFDWGEYAASFWQRWNFVSRIIKIEIVPLVRSLTILLNIPSPKTFLPMTWNS